MSGQNPSDKKAAYQAWADRMKTRSSDAKTAAKGAPETPTLSANWSTNALFAESAWVVEQEKLDASQREHIARLLRTFNLPGDASFEQVTEVYRRMAKSVHPDLHEDKTVRTQAANIGKMIEFNATYEELRSLMAPGSS